jgi:hypothetical protein
MEIYFRDGDGLMMGMMEIDGDGDGDGERD